MVKFLSKDLIKHYLDVDLSLINFTFCAMLPSKAFVQFHTAMAKSW